MNKPSRYKYRPQDILIEEACGKWGVLLAPIGKVAQVLYECTTQDEAVQKRNDLLREVMP